MTSVDTRTWQTLREAPSQLTEEQPKWLKNLQWQQPRKLLKESMPKNLPLLKEKVKKEGVPRNQKSNVKTGLRLQEIMPKESFPINHKSNVEIIAWPSGTAQSMIIVDVFKPGRCLKICPYCKALKFNGETMGMYCASGKVKLPLLAAPQIHWRLCLLELRQNLSVFYQTSENITHVSKWCRLVPKSKIKINLCLLSK